MVTSNTPAVTGALPAPWLARCAAWIRRQLAGRHGDRRVPDAIDWAIAAGCFVAFTVPVLLGAGLAGHSRDAVAAFGAMAAAPLVVRRRWPVAVVAAVAGVYVAAALVGVAFTPFVSNAGPDLAIAVFAAADRRPRHWSLPAAVGAAIATWAALPAAIALHPHQDQDAVQLLLIIPAWIAGDMDEAHPQLPAAASAGVPPPCRRGGPARPGGRTTAAVPGSARRRLAQLERDRRAGGHGPACARRAAWDGQSRPVGYRDVQPVRAR